MPFSKLDKEMMQRALFLAKKGQYSTKPNPAVGCVIVKDGHIIAEGWHARAGLAHAEKQALNLAKEQGVDVVESTVYVTLEPCSHTGKTAPCSNALVDAKVSRVVVAMQDPNPLVSGSGCKHLSEAGILVEQGCLGSEAEELNQGFIKVMQSQLPFVRLKMASSLDGKTAMASGESKWITGESSRKAVHFMRARHGAIITGIGTVLADDPSLTVRLTNEELAGINLNQDNCQPIKLVLDSDLSMPLNAKMLGMSGRILVVTSKESINEHSSRLDALISKGVEVVAVASKDNKLDIESVLRYLVEKEQVNDVMVESGAILAGSFLKSGFVDEIHSFIAPSVMGDQAKPMFILPHIESMADKLQFEFSSCDILGKDIYLVLKSANNH